ncbi:unnamed protein product [Rotaria sp. Silwood2]|nr:unnamed protein product [Rotaria sp. Silwood2]CAF2799613.1 unnamed protein product [Rotaria sp. Silwood2]CAF3088517.1 unnamed protein product [Rotaria sp. Silwood2]CAF4199115.1 unnamed protein product [Rotaria sp. Silwood2]CAF4276554.1 unnamed protein product [Rotaria sp. Silwood2]
MRSTHTYNDLIKRGGVQSMEKNDLFYKRELWIDPGSPLSILFTSGSTGHPKPVVLTNIAIVNSTKILANHFGAFCLRYCAPLSMVHISTGIRGALLPSATRCTVIIPSQAYDAAAVMRAIDEEKCTCMMAGPALFHNILAHSDRHKYSMTSLQYVSLSGTSIKPELLRKLETELGIGRTGQVYGMTESASLLTSSLYAKSNDNRKHTSIGQCMPHIELKLVNDNGITVPIGIQGEVWARGYSVMHGYYNDCEKTAETITDDGWLRTGDLAKMDQDGYFYFVGRKKEIIIRDTGNVYPIEIEMVIGEHPSVSEVHVFSIPDSFTDAVVCAFVALQPTMTCEVEELKLFLSDKLAAYKIPEHIRFVGNFPRTSTGKVSKLKLAEIMVKEINTIS